MKNISNTLGKIYDTNNEIYSCAIQHRQCECANNAALITSILNLINEQLPQTKQFLHTNKQQ